MIDFILYFNPSKETLRSFGIRRYFYFGKDGDGIILENKSASYIRSFFVKNYKKYLFFGVINDSKNSLLRIVREGIVDFVLNPPIDYTILKFCKENKVRIVLSLREVSIEKMKYFYGIVELCNKMKLKVILTSEARNEEELIPKRLFYAFAEEVGGNPTELLYKNALELYRLCKVRRKCELPGVYIEEVS